MTDIIERLRDGTLSPYRQWELCGEAADEIERLRKEVECLQLTIKGFHSGIAAAQARESVMRDILGKVEYVQPSHLAGKINKALDIPHDNSALKERLAQERERCAKVCNPSQYPNEADRNIAHKCAAAICNLGDE